MKPQKSAVSQWQCLLPDPASQPSPPLHPFVAAQVAIPCRPAKSPRATRWNPDFGGWDWMRYRSEKNPALYKWNCGLRIRVTTCFFNVWEQGTARFWLVVGPPLWKIWKSIGMMTFPIYGKIKNGNQTTNQDLMALSLSLLFSPWYLPEDLCPVPRPGRRQFIMSPRHNEFVGEFQQNVNQPLWNLSFVKMLKYVESTIW